MTEYRAVIELRPTHAPGHCNLGNLHEELGDLKAAEAGYRTALHHDAHLPSAHAQLATLLRGKLPEEDLAALQRLLGRPHLALGSAWPCTSAWPTSSTAAASTPKAADHVQRGNELCQTIWRQQGQAYDPRCPSRASSIG